MLHRFRSLCLHETASDEPIRNDVVRPNPTGFDTNNSPSDWVVCHTAPATASGSYSVARWSRHRSLEVATVVFAVGPWLLEITNRSARVVVPVRLAVAGYENTRSSSPPSRMLYLSQFSLYAASGKYPRIDQLSNCAILLQTTTNNRCCVSCGKCQSHHRIHSPGQSQSSRFPFSAVCTRVTYISVHP